MKKLFELKENKTKEKLKQRLSTFTEYDALIEECKNDGISDRLRAIVDKTKQSNKGFF